MLRVLHCIYDDPDNPWVGGGGALRVRELYRRLVGEVEATVATGAFPGAADREIDGIHYRRLGLPRPYAASRLTYGLAATRLLARGDYDVGLFDYSVYTPIRLPRDRPVGLVVHMLHGPTAGGRWGAPGAALVNRVEVAGIRSARWISTTSRWMVEQLQPLVAPGTRIVPVGSGVPPEFTAVQREEADHFLFYGRLDIYQKGLDTLLAAFARFRADHPGFRLVIAGRGKDEAELVEMIRESGLASAVELIPRPARAQVLTLMAGALAMVMPSRLEGLPMAPAEAMAAAVPVIASRVGAVEEIVISGSTGLIVPPADPAALAAAMSRLAADADLRAAMSAEARRSAARFSWDTVARAHLDYLRAIAGDVGSYSPAPSSA
ncbi:MAG TPA: glycosyltransferase [Longimicrobiaceae bacterium]